MLKLLYNKYFSFICVVIICITIFLFSNQPGEISSQISNNTLTRKIGHILEYFALSFFFTAFLTNFFYITKNKIIIIFYSFLFITIYASLDEFHQTFIANRNGSITDIIIDTIGGILGIILSITIKNLQKKNI